jgi:deoxycytidine triphosphate deaminase
MPGYATSDADAEARYSRYREVDPFPEILPSVLNIADISDYVAAAGVIFPFPTAANYLKPASFGIALRGRCIYWEGDGKRKDFILSDSRIERYSYEDYEYRTHFELVRNSIAFVTLEPFIRLPNYIALRFNLAIREVYRGFLLGTGPMVDPGFQGRLSFPLHNLTDQSYRIRAGEQIVWVELTKISKLPAWDRGPASEIRTGIFHKFPDRKNSDRTDLFDYLVHANNGDPVRSSIPVEIETSRSAAVEARDRAVKAEGWVQRIKGFSFVGAAALFLALAAAIVGGYQIVSGTLGLIDGARKELDIAADKNKAMNDKIKQLQKTVDSDDQQTQEAIRQLQKRVDSLDQKTRR